MIHKVQGLAQNDSLYVRKYSYCVLLTKDKVDLLVLTLKDVCKIVREKARYRTVYINPFMLKLYVCVFIWALKFWKDITTVST